MHHIRGMTLVELATTIAVAAIVLGIALPAFGALRERTQLATARHQLTASLMTARTGAITRRVPVSLCPSTDGARCRGDIDWSEGWIVFEDPARTNQPAHAGRILRRIDAMPAGLAVTSTTGRTLVRFRPDGRAAGTNLSLRLCSRHNRRLLGTVIVNNGGRARSETPSVNSRPCPFAP